MFQPLLPPPPGFTYSLLSGCDVPRVLTCLVAGLPFGQKGAANVVRILPASGPQVVEVADRSRERTRVDETRERREGGRRSSRDRRRARWWRGRERDLND
eukprot:756021-Hanusia_phi.AAC.6